MSLEGELGLPEAASVAVFSPDGGRVFLRFAKPPAWAAYDLASGKRAWTADAPDGLCVPSPDGRLLLVGGRDGREPVAVLDAATGKTLDVPAPDCQGVRSAAFAPDGASWAAPEGDGVAIRSVKTGKVVRKLPVAADRVAYSPDGKWVATLGAVFDVWDAATGKRKWPDAAADGHVRAATAAAWSRDGTTAVTASYIEGRVIAWDARTAAIRWSASTEPGWPVVVSVGDREVLAVVRKGRGETEQALIAWDAATGKRLRSLDLAWDGQIGHRTFAFGPGGTRVVMAADDRSESRGTAWDAATGKRFDLWTARTDRETWDWIATSADCRHMLLHGGRLRRLADGRQGPTLEAPAGWHVIRFGAAFSPDSALVAATLCNDDRKNPAFRQGVWERTTGRLLRATDAVRSSACEWLPDGRRVVAMSAERRAIYDAATGAFDDAKLPPWTAASIPATRVWLPGGRSVATVGVDPSVLVWDVGVGPAKVIALAGEAAWAALAGDAAEAWRGVWALAETKAADVLGRVKEVVPADAAVVARLVTKLDAAEFRTREAATKELKARRTGRPRPAGGAGGQAVGRGGRPDRGLARRLRGGPDRRSLAVDPGRGRAGANRHGRRGQGVAAAGRRRARCRGHRGGQGGPRPPRSFPLTTTVTDTSRPATVGSR